MKRSGSEPEKLRKQGIQPQPYVELNHPEWTKNATLYEVNIRQYTPEGTFEAFSSHLPRLKSMGIDILWLMPVHPIGEKNRKGRLGSYYSVKDYYGINPEFGSMEDFKSLVNEIHRIGMHVIIDWVANHSAWDNPLTREHPEWYLRSKDGSFQPTPWFDWDDIIGFDYDQPGIRKYMTEAMKFWVKETGIDGFRCDVAGFIPVDFWENAREELEKIKPVFLLAEWESRDLHKKAFDMTYSWSLWERLRDATAGQKGIARLLEYIAHDVNSFPKGAYRMTFTDNHDKNSWDGDQFSTFGDGLYTAMVMSGVVNGIPLVYSGQEAGLDRSLLFFDKDLIPWRNHEIAWIYSKLFKLKHKNQALWNGEWGGKMVRVANDKADRVISFVREKNGHSVVSVLSFCDEKLSVRLDTKLCTGRYTEIFTGREIQLAGEVTFDLKPWSYLVFSTIPVE